MDAATLEMLDTKRAEPPAPSTPTQQAPVSGKPSEVDRALEVAFGVLEEGPKSQPPPQSPPPQAAGSSPPRSSLEEISLGETGVVPVSPRPARAEEPPAQRPSDRDIDLGGMEPPGDTIRDEEKPHDYDWFINEIQKVAHAAPGSKPKVPEPPSIQPVESGRGTQDAPRAALPRDSQKEPAPSGRANADAEELAEARRGYDEFISEFRREIARLEGVVSPADAAPAEEPAPSGSGKFSFEPLHADLTSAVPAAPPPTAKADPRVMELSDKLIESVTALVARELAAKLDSKTIYALLEQKLKEAQKNSGA